MSGKVIDPLALAGWLFGVVCALIGLLYGIVLYELRLMRRKVHAHRNLLTRCSIVIQELCRKVGVHWPKNPDED